MNDKILKLFKYIIHPSDVILYLDGKRIINISDKAKIKLMYKKKINKKIDLKNPKTFNEKLQWLKLYDRNPEYTKMVDKYEVKQYIKEKIGQEYIIPTLGVWESFDEIDFDKLPNKFVLKCTHDSGGIVICKDKTKLNLRNAKTKINKSLRRNYYKAHREWPYKNVKHRIIAEEYVEDATGGLADYKVYAFDGKCDYVMACTDREKGDTKFVYYDRNWNMIREFTNHAMQYGDNIKIDKPKTLDRMFEFAEELSRGIPFVRVDFYEVNGKLYFGELTFYPSAGFDKKRRPECEAMLTENLKIANKDEKR